MKPKELLGLIKEHLTKSRKRIIPSLIAGELGILLFLIEYNASLGIQDDEIEKRLEVTFQDFQSSNDTYFAHGLSGLGWFLQHLTNKNLIETESIEIILEQLDELIYSSAIYHLDKNNHDFLHGSLGNAVYLIPRATKTSKISEYLRQIVDKLKTGSRASNLGIFWEDSKLNPNNLSEKVTLGLAHGMASKIAFFSKLVDIKFEEEKSRNLLMQSVNYIRACKFTTYAKNSVYPIFCVNGIPTDESRLAWCHGDLGIGLALLQAGKTLQDEEIISDAINTCLKTTERKLVKNTHIVDSSLCHGIAGALHMYNILYENTGNERFREAANYWLGQLLNKVRGSNLSGLDTWDNVNKKWVKDDGLLNGLAGIGLALLSHKSRDFEWSSCLLMK